MPASRSFRRLTRSVVLPSCVSLSLASSCALAGGAPPAKTEAAPAPAAPIAASAEGVVRIRATSEPEGIARLRALPYVRHLVRWLYPEPSRPALAIEVIDRDAGVVHLKLPFGVVAPDAGCQKADGSCGVTSIGNLVGEMGPVSSLHHLRNRMIQRIEAVTGTSSSAPHRERATPAGGVPQRAVDVGAVEDLLFPDPATAERIIQAAGQGFRVVVLQPTADPHPIQDSLDCPRPIFQNHTGERHPEPTPIPTAASSPLPPAPRPVPPAPLPAAVLAERPGIAIVPRRPPAPLPGPAEPPAILQKLPHLSQLFGYAGSKAAPIAPPTEKPRPAVAATPARTAPAPASAPRQGREAMSPGEHLRMAANQLREGGLPQHADQLVRQANELEQQARNRVEQLHRQIAELQQEVQRVERLAGVPQMISIRVRMIEFDRDQLATPEGQALLKRHGHQGDDSQGTLSEALSRLARSPEFLKDAVSEKCARVVCAPSLVSAINRPATFMSGGEFPVPESNGTSFRPFGIRMESVVTAVGGNRVRIDVAPEISERDMSNAVQVNGFTIPGLISRRINTQLELALGETAVIGGLISLGTVAPEAQIQPVAHVASKRPEVEMMFLVTVERVEEAAK